MISLKGEQLKSDYLLLATGSSSVGHSIAKSLGHSITDLSPSLFTFEIESELQKVILEFRSRRRDLS